MRGRLIGGQALFRLITRTYIDAPRRPNLILYTSDDCSLCVHFKKHLEYFLDKNNLDLKIDYRDIKQCDQLIFEQYKHSIPVLVSVDQIVWVGFNMPDDVAKWCAEALKLTDDEITQSVSFLEDHKFFNCGVGSNLTAQGTVECEAGYMTSKYFRFGAVGCVSTVKNPILAARAMALDNPAAPGLAKPQVLVGRGAEQWARERNLEMCEPEDLITSTAQKEWREMTQKLVESAPLMLSTLTKMDTVGGVAVKDGHAEACVSSGGILYKRPGRLGQCTFFGSGVWTDKSGDTLIAVSASGLGEALVRTDFCRSLARTVMNRNNQDLPAQVVEQWFQTEFLRSPYLTDIPPQMILAGSIVILQEAGCSELLVVHNTPSFPLAFKSRGKVKRVISKSSPQSPKMSDGSLSEEEPLEIEYTNDEESLSRSSSVAESASTASKEGNAPPYFEIPISDDDLKVFNRTAYHTVEDDDIEEDLVREEVEIFASKLPDEGWRALKNHFDAFFCLAKINTKIKNDELWLLAARKLLDCYHILYHGSLRKALKRSISSNGRVSDEVIYEITNVANNVLMLVYLLNRLSLHLESWYMSRLLGLEKKKGARKLDLDENMEKWTQLRVRIVECFTQICEITITDNNGNEKAGAIKFLWRPPEVDKRMITTMIETAFKFLENPTNKAVASLPWLKQIFTLIRSICIRYDYFSRMAVALVEKTVNLDYLREASASKYPFIQAIIAVSQNGDMDLLLSHMVHHLGDIINADFNSTSTKPYSLLMTTMAELAPDIMIKQLSAILPYLQNDIPQFRASVLQCFAHLLCSGNLSESVCAQFSRVFKVRNRMLEFCRDHLKDENANVRNKALQVWVTLAENKRIPPEQLQKALLSSIGDRLMDKSLMCRKSAFKFMLEFIESNPYGHDFDYDLHVKKLSDLNATRRRLKSQDPSDQTTAIAFTEFDEVRPTFEKQLRDSLQKHRDGLDEDLGKDLDPSVVLWAIGTQIVKYPVASARTVAALVTKGQFGKIDPNGEPEQIVDSCLDLCLKMYCSSKKRNRNMDNEAQLALEDEINDHKEEMNRIGKEITQLIDKIIVSKEISECIPKAMRAVLLGDLTEMIEAMKFIVKCKHFNVKGSDQAVRQMCSLIWRHNQDIRKEVLNTAETLFVSANRNPEIKVKSTVENLFTVLTGMKDEERACVEEVISKMAVTELPEGTAKYVWKLAENTNPEKQKVALQLIGILVKSDKDLRKYLRHMQAIVKDRQLPSKVRVEALSAIANMADFSKHSTEPGWVFRLPANDSLFTVIETFVIEEFMRSPTSRDGSVWFEAMQAALSIYFDVAKDTNSVLCRLTGKILVIAHRVSGVVEHYTEEFMRNTDETMMRLIEDMKKKYTGMFCFFIERCLVLAGEIAMRTVIHVDVTWFREVKKLPELVGMARRGELVAKKAPNRLLTEWEFRSAMHRGLFNYSTRDDNNPHGNTDDDRVRGIADNILNRKLFRNGRLLARLAPFVMYALRAESSPASIRDAAAVAFSKFMLVSREFSERGAPLFFMILNNSMNPTVRHNFIVASGDLCFRMPNLVEKYSNNVYAMTRDPEPMVRETAILVLTHLLTNHMLKHRGCLADVAKLITDRVSEISTLTKEFFAELGTRGIVYNLLPDFISRLSRSSREVSLQQFKTIMSFLLQQIKDKQMDTLVEKMCARFAYVKTDHATSKNSKIAHYYSFCISQINLSEKAFVKMRDNLNNFATFMEDQQVYEDFKAPLEKLIKTTKNADLQFEVPEFLAQLTAIHNRGLTGEEFAQPRQIRARGGRGRTRGSSSNSSVVSRTATRRRRVIDSDSDELDDIEGS